MKETLPFLVIWVLLLSSGSSQADIPRLINYQGMLTDDSGTPLNQKVDLTFSIYDDSASTNYSWREAYTGVSVVHGLFNVILGSLIPIDLDFSEQYWLEVQVDNDTLPRMKFTSVGYAYRSLVADSAVVASSSGEGGGWVDDGTVVRLQNASDNVSIGITDPMYKTDITVGSGGGTALRLRSAGTTTNLQTILRFSNSSTNDATGNYSSYVAGVRTNYPVNGAQALIFGTSGSSAPPTERMRIDPQGRVGIGTANPQYSLDVSGDIRASGSLHIPSSQGRIENADTNAVLETWWRSDFGDYTAINSGYAWTGDEPYSIVAGNQGFFFTKGSEGTPYATKLVRIDTEGRVGVGISNPGGHKLHVTSSQGGVSGSAVHVVNSASDGLAMTLDNTSTDVTLLVSQHGNGPLLRCDSWVPSWHPVFEVKNSGRVICSELQLTGGSDLSEQFDIRALKGEAQPGMVVCIDPENPGKLVVSTKSYDRKVAGIISGAGEIQTGLLMGQQGSTADGSHAVALTGRVFCRADASRGAIRPGDLLTTSDRPGHAMKVSDYTKAQGAIIGKAMSSLDEGQGLVLVLVALQ